MLADVLASSGPPMTFGSKLTILIADSNDYSAQLTATMLRTSGVHHIAMAGTAGRALRALEHNRFDAIIVDFDLDGDGGVAFTRALRQAQGAPYRETPVIMVCGETEAERIKAARDAGVTEFVKKPMSANILMLRIEAALARPRAFIAAPGYAGPDRRRRPDAAAPRRERRAKAKSMEPPAG